MAGSVARPATSTVSVVVPDVEVASMSRAGVRSPANVMRLRSEKSRRRLRIVRRPRRMVKAPATSGAAAEPRIVMLPPTSASMPRPRTKICEGASSWISSMMVEDFSRGCC